MNQPTQKLSKCCKQPAVFTKHHKDYPLGKYFCGGVNGCGKWCEVEEPTQDEFDWSEVENYITGGSFYKSLPETSEKIIDFIKSHCVPRREYDEAVVQCEWLVREHRVKDEKIENLQDKLAAAEKKLKAVRKWADTWDILYNSGDGVDFDELQTIIKPSPEVKK